MPLDRRIELRISENIGSLAVTVETVWADRQSASIERIEQALATFSGTLFVDYRIRWRADVEAIIPGLLVVRDDADNEYEVSGVSTDDQRRSFLTIHCSRSETSRNTS